MLMVRLFWENTAVTRICNLTHVMFYCILFVFINKQRVPPRGLPLSASAERSYLKALSP